MLKADLEIVLVTYNRINSLRNTLLSIFAEDSPIKDLQITLLDNKSNDGTFELCQEYAQKYKNLKHVVHNRNIGGNANIARAFEIASKKYLWVLCDDDNYDWKNFDKIQNALNKDYDLIFTIKGETGKISNEAEMFYMAAFVPACIYKTEILSATLMDNIMFNISNFFPHLCPAAKILNDNKKIYLPDFSIILRGTGNDNIKTFTRGTDEEDIAPLRKNMFWLTGYINSVQMIKDEKKRAFIIDNLRYNHKSLFDLFQSNIYLNKVYYNNSLRNLYMIFSGLNFRQKLLFSAATVKVFIRSLFIRKYIDRPNSSQEWTEYFELVNQKQKIKQLSGKYKNKKVIIYGLGIMTNVLFENYDMKKFNIVAIADRKFKKGDKFLQYNGIPPEEITQYSPDVILICNYRDSHIKKALLKAGVTAKTEHILKKSKFVYVSAF